MVYISSKYRKQVLVHLCSSFYWSLMGRKAAVKQHKHVQNYADITILIFFAMAIAIANIRVTNMIMFYLHKKAMTSSTFQIRKVRGIVPGGCLHQREVRLAQVSCGIVAGKFNSKFVQSLICGQICNISDPNLIVRLSMSCCSSVTLRVAPPN